MAILQKKLILFPFPEKQADKCGKLHKTALRFLAILTIVFYALFCFSSLISSKNVQKLKIYFLFF